MSARRNCGDKMRQHGNSLRTPRPNFRPRAVRGPGEVIGGVDGRALVGVVARDAEAVPGARAAPVLEVHHRLRTLGPGHHAGVGACLFAGGRTFSENRWCLKSVIKRVVKTGS